MTPFSRFNLKLFGPICPSNDTVELSSWTLLYVRMTWFALKGGIAGLIFPVKVKCTSSIMNVRVILLEPVRVRIPGAVYMLAGE